MEVREIKTYELEPPLRGFVYVIFDDAQSAAAFDEARQKFPSDDICSMFTPVYLTNQRWAQVKSDFRLYPEEFQVGIKIIVPNPRRHEGQKRMQDQITWNRYNEFKDVWQIIYLGYFTGFGVSDSYKHGQEFNFDRDKAKEFEKDAWESYVKESEEFKLVNGFNWAYLEKFSPGIIENKLIKDCLYGYAGFTTDFWKC